jgi:hypothetical protein
MIDASAKWFRRLLLASIYVLGVLGIVGSGGGDNEFASGTITVNPITADDVVNAAEAAGIINVTGSVRGLPESFFGNVNFLVNGTVYFGPASPNFSFAVSGADLAADTSFRAAAIGAYTIGFESFPVRAFTTSTHTVDIGVRAKVPVDNITDDDVINTVITSASLAILGSIDFDATQVDFSTVTFGRDGASPVHDGHVEDVNVDGFMDMEFHFKTQETGIVCGDTEVILMGETFCGIQFTGTDTVKTVECK